MLSSLAPAVLLASAVLNSSLPNGALPHGAQEGPPAQQPSAGADAQGAPAPEEAVQREPWKLTDLYGPERLRGERATGLVWRPDGAAVLYRKTVDGTTHLFEHEVATGKERALFDWSAMVEALRAQRPKWSKPAMDDTNRTGRFAFDPQLSPDGARMVGLESGDLFLVDLMSGAARFITEGSEPELFFRFRPDSAAVGYARDGDLFVYDLTENREKRLTNRAGKATVQNGVADWVHEEELDLRQSWWWSPDGTRIAYFQFDVAPVSVFPITDEMEPIAALEPQRYPKTGGDNAHVRLGILDLNTSKTTWVASGDDPEGYLVDAAWLDGNQLWYQWLNRDQTRLELRLVNTSGETRVLVGEDDKRWVNVGPDPLFLPDGTFLWTSERDGWRHIYHYGLDGRLRGRVTAGDWEVHSVDGLLEDGGAVLYTSNEGTAGATEQHVFRIGLDGQRKLQLSRDGGWHSANLSPAADHWLDSWSSHASPPRVELVRTTDNAVIRSLDDGAIPRLAGKPYGVTRFRQLTLEGGHKVWTRMIFPPDFDANDRYPVVIYVYGGPGAQVVRNRWDGTRGYYQRFLAQQGAIVFSLDNRGSGGRGRDYARQLHRRLGSLEVEDQILGAEWLRAQPWVDGERIGIYGGSYGGFMTLHCLMRAPELFRAGVSYAPVTDFRFYDTIYTERYMDTPADNAEGYSDGAPLEHVDGLRDDALLLVHGTMDNNVHLQNSIQLLDRLARAGKEFELMLYPRTRHAMRIAEYSLHFHQLSYGFLARKLGLDD